MLWVSLIYTFHKSLLANTFLVVPIISAEQLQGFELLAMLLKSQKPQS